MTVFASFQNRAGPKRAVTVCVMVAMAVVGAWMWWEQRIAVDDAFISYRYASNFVHGDGLVYNHGERVEGYSNFLWVMFAAAAIRANLDPFLVTRYAGAASYVLLLAILGGFFVRVVVEENPKRLWLLPVLGALIVPSGYAALSGSGLETAFIALLFATMGLAQYWVSPRGPLGRIAVSGLAITACLTRLDAVLAVGASGLASIVEERGKGGSWGGAVSTAAKRVFPPFLAVVLYLLWKLSYYGDILPNSYYAKGADQFQLAAGLAYVAAFVRSDPQVIPFLLLAVLALVGGSQREMRPLCVYAGATLIAYLLFIVKVGGDFMQFRFIWQIYPLCVLLGIVGLQWVARRSFPLAVAWAVLVLGLSFFKPEIERRFGMQTLAEMNHFVEEGRTVGLGLREKLPRDTVIATKLAGTIPYFSDLFAIDQWSLNERVRARQEAGGDFYRGHLKYAGVEYLIQRGVNLSFGYPVFCPCSNPCVESGPNVFVRFGSSACLRSRYLVPKRELTRHFCSHPGDFLLHLVRCPKRDRRSDLDREETSTYHAVSPRVEPLPGGAIGMVGYRGE